MFASTDAAAMHLILLSPFIMHWCGISCGLNRLPSIRRISGRTSNLSVAKCIAKNDAFSMLISSIFSWSMNSTAQDTACSIIIGRKVLRLSLIHI